MRDEAHPEHRPLQDQTLLDGEDGNAVFADRREPRPVWTKASGGLSRVAVAMLMLGISAWAFSQARVTARLLVLS